MSASPTSQFVAIACGGTGGHLFPGMAVSDHLRSHGLETMLMVSPKEVDQRSVRASLGSRVVTLPAVPLNPKRLGSFVSNFWKSYRLSVGLFRDSPPKAVLGMGGFTSVPPILAGRRVGVPAFLHEANVIPGRANRWAAHLVKAAFVYFPETADRLGVSEVTVTGMPVRAQFEPMEASSCRIALGLLPDRPTLLIMGGSQGASAINQLVLRSLGVLARRLPELQFLHLTGTNDLDKVKSAYELENLKALVRPFLSEMELALGAATVAVSRAGASSLAEFAAMQIPSILIPYPAAADNHQFFNAESFVRSHAARMLSQSAASPDALVDHVAEILHNDSLRRQMKLAASQRHNPDAALDIANEIIAWTDRHPALPTQTRASTRGFESGIEGHTDCSMFRPDEKRNAALNR